MEKWLVYITGLFGGAKQTQAPATTLRINTSLQGVPIPIILGGAQRIAGNVIDYVNLVSYPVCRVPDQAPQRQGRRRRFGGKGAGGNSQYFVTFLIAFGEGPVADSRASSLMAVGGFPPIPTTGDDLARP